MKVRREPPHVIGHDQSRHFHATVLDVISLDGASPRSTGATAVQGDRRPSPKTCAEVQTHLRSLGGEALGVAEHLGRLEDLDALVGETVETFGGIDVVVNNAATALAQPIAEQTPEAWAKSFEVNLRGPVFLTQRAFPHLIASPYAAVLSVVSVGALFSRLTSRCTQLAKQR